MAQYPKKVIVVGLDGVTTPFVERLIEEHKLPNIESFLNEGTLAPQTFSSLPTSTPENWTSIANGAHQVMSFQTFQPEELHGRWMCGYSSEESESEFIWDALERAGKQSILLKYPASWPPTAESVLQVCGCHVRPCAHQLDGAYLFATVERNGATHLDLKNAEGWDDLPETGPTPLETIITFGRRSEADKEPSVGLGVPVCKIPPDGKRYHLLVYGSDDRYERIAVCPQKDRQTAVADMAAGEWSEWLVEDFVTTDGHRDGSFRFRLEELSPDAEKLRLFSTHIVDIDHYTSPEELGRELHREVGPYICDIGWDGLGHNRNRDWIEPETFVELADYQNQWMSNALAHLTETRDWDLTMMQVHCIDCINHYCLTLADPATNPREKEAAYYRSIIEELHKSLDRMVGRIMEIAGDDTTIVLVSDHGGMPDGPKPDLKRILAEADLAKLDANGNIDLTRSRAYPSGSNFVNVNRKDRDPQGTVDPEDYEKVQEGIMSALVGEVHPETGRHPFNLVLSKRDARILGLWNDPTGKKIGDVVYALREGFGGTHGQQLSSARHGMGANQSLLAFSGPGIRHGHRLERTTWLVDIVPTLCYMLDAPVPEDCHGSVLHQIFEDHPGSDRYR
ncbi:MAG: alkaline phosphatase family protein [Candidatus Brocadiia bacterium]